MAPLAFSCDLSIVLFAGLFIVFLGEAQDQNSCFRVTALISLWTCLFILIFVLILSFLGSNITWIIGRVVIVTGFLCGHVILRDGFISKCKITATTL